MHIYLLALGDSLEATTMRAVLETQSHAVSLHFVATPEQFFVACNEAAERADALIISAHGDEAGFVFPLLAEGVSAIALNNNILTPALLQKQLTQAPRLVLSTACLTGQAQLADIFLSAGAHCFVAPRGQPEGADIPPIVGLLLRQESADRPIRQTLEQMVTLLPDAEMFACFDSRQ